ncbi:MAG: (d)CMP kinase [Gammaproteobacteria bacterium]|nr:(d)CMP kinase [Gammaproteobacteria bacterium]
MTANESAPVVAIDGPGGVGKGTAALLLARHLGRHILDSGAIYRILALAAQNHGLDFSDEKALSELALDLNVQFDPLPDFSGIRVILDGREVSREVRGEATGAAASRVAALPSVRQALLARQRAFRVPPGLVADGRDMGTVVFPDARVKIFLTADSKERANRRYKQLKEKGIDVNLTALVQELGERDKRDSARATAPLKAAADAVVIDTTKIDAQAVFTRVLECVTSTRDG